MDTSEATSCEAFRCITAAQYEADGAGYHTHKSVHVTKEMRLRGAQYITACASYSKTKNKS